MEFSDHPYERSGVLK